MTGLAPQQVDALLAPLDKRRVKQVQGNSHLEAWDIRRHLLRVFGWGGWSFEVVSCECILERSSWDENSTHKGRHTVAYRVIGRLTIRSGDVVLAVFEDGATGDAQNQPTFADAHDMALKTAMSQALKRCAVNLGDRFGLSLYNKGGSSAVVGRSVAHAADGHDADDEVTGGELDEARHVTDDEDATQQGAVADGSASGGDAAKGGDGADSHDVGRSEPEAAPDLADHDQHTILRTALDALDPDDLASVKAWWQQQHLPSIKDADALTVDQVEAAFAHLEALHDAKQSMAEKRKERARQIAEDAGLPVPEHLSGPAKARAALGGGE